MSANCKTKSTPPTLQNISGRYVGLRFSRPFPVVSVAVIFVAFVVVSRPVQTVSSSSSYSHQYDQHGIPSSGASPPKRSSRSSSLTAVSSISSSALQSCVYEDHLITDKTWFGYLANITVASTGRLTFEFVYPADRCCQNVLFYSEDQMAVINARMNCWQKENRLRPEDDQILRLTPRFPWSGCHMTHPGNVATYTCKGGRSFTIDQYRLQQQQQQYQHGAGGGGGGAGYGASRASGDRPTTWYVAVSNCGSLHGLDLQYRMEVFGHVGECRTSAIHSNVNPLAAPAHHHSAHLPSPHPVLQHPSNKVPSSVNSKPDSAAETAAAASSAIDDPAAASSAAPPLCTVSGLVNTTDTWFGFIANVSVQPYGGFRYRIAFPSNVHVVDVLLYGEDDLPRLTVDSNCWDRQAVIPADRVHDKIIELSIRVKGCSYRNGSLLSPTGGQQLSCEGDRQFFTPRRLFVAFSNCRASHLLVHYQLDVFGFDRTDSCSSATSVLNLTLTRGRLAIAAVAVIAFVSSSSSGSTSAS